MNLSAISHFGQPTGFLLRLLTWILIAFAASASLLLLSLRYWLLPDIEQYRENIAHAISSASGQHVTIGRINANWDGFRPHMVMQAIKVHDKDGDVTLLLHRLESTLSWRSILHGKLHFREIEIDQPDLVVRRDTSGVIHWAGVLLEKEGSGSENGFSDWLLNQRRVIIKNASILWQDDQRGAPELELLVNLRLENRGHRHRFGLSATPAAKLAARLDIRGDFTGESFDTPELWRGRLFTQIDEADVAAWHVWLPFPHQIKLNRGVGALRMWARIDGANMNKFTADLRLRNVKAQLAPDLPELSLTGLRGRVGWQKMKQGSKEGVELFAQNLSASLRDKRENKPLNFSLQFINGNDGKPSSGKLEGDNLNLEFLAKLAKYVPMDTPLRVRLDKISPRGDLHHIEAKWVDGWSAPSTFTAKGKFSNLGMEKSGIWPAFSGISGNMRVSEQGGSVNLDSQNSKVDFPDIFHKPFKLKTLAGRANWVHSHRKDSLLLEFTNVSFSNHHASGLASGSYRSTRDGPGFIDLVGHLPRADASYLIGYFPISANSDSREWLENSVAEGEFSDVRLHLKGNLADFPFVDDNGIFRLQAKASGISIDSIHEWPRIENISGNLQFLGKQMILKASQANILGTNLSTVKLHVADITSPDAVVKSEIEANGGTQEFVTLAAQKMASRQGPDLLNGVSIIGDGKLVLQVDVPVHRPDAFKLSGNYHFVDNELDLGAGIPNLNAVNGSLAFTESGIRIESLTAQLLGGPVAIDFTDMPDGSARLSALGRINLDNLDKQRTATNAMQPWKRHLRGSADWQATVHVNNNLVDVLVESSLRGITSDLPEPFSKASADSAPLRFERKATAPDRDNFIFSYGNAVTAEISRARNSIGNYQTERGIITFGARTPRSFTEKAGTTVSGTLPVLNLDRWNGLLNQVKDETGSSLNLTGIKLHVGTLDFLGKRFKDLTVNAGKTHGVWHSRITGNEVDGNVNWDPFANGKVVARLNRLVIPANSPYGPEKEMQTGQKSKYLPTLDVTADQFLIGEKYLGKLELVAGQQEQNWRVHKLDIISPESSIMARGLWQNQLAAPHVQAALTLEASDIGTFLTRLGLPDRVKRGSGKLQGVVSWSGGPQSIDYSTLSGNFNLNAKRGQFPEFEPGIGRLFGIFNLRALPRRIRLDFHDVFSEGFGFDDISGEIKLARGLAYTDNLRIEGPSAKIDMNGQMNLEAETQRFQIKVTPSYGLATPVVGMASVIAKTALQNPVTINQYNITGTWTDPVVTKTRRREQESGKQEQ